MRLPWRRKKNGEQDPKLRKAAEQEERADEIAERVNRLKDTQTIVTIRTHRRRTG